MKDPLQRTKVVVRHLPPTLSQSDFLALINDRVADRYNWFAYRVGKSTYCLSFLWFEISWFLGFVFLFVYFCLFLCLVSHKQQRFARAYLELKRPEDVFEFAELLDGHVFVNDKGIFFN